MLTNHEPDHNIEDLTHTDVYEAIRYLEPDPKSANAMVGDDRDKDSGAIIICAFLFVALLACLAFVWFYWR